MLEFEREEREFMFVEAVFRRSGEPAGVFPRSERKVSYLQVLGGSDASRHEVIVNFRRVHTGLYCGYKWGLLKRPSLVPKATAPSRTLCFLSQVCTISIFHQREGEVCDKIVLQ